MTSLRTLNRKKQKVSRPAQGALSAGTAAAVLTSPAVILRRSETKFRVLRNFCQTLLPQVALIRLPMS